MGGHRRRLPACGCPPVGEEGDPCPAPAHSLWPLPPASRQTRAAALSNANPRRPNTPANGHAARWWPRESSGRPHRQVNEDRGKGCQRRRRNSTLNSWDWKVVSAERGKLVKGRPAIGPCWERRRACSGCASVGQTDRAKKTFSTTSEAFCCHPFLLKLGNWSAAGSKSGRSPLARSPHSGASKPNSTRLSRLRAAASVWGPPPPLPRVTVMKSEMSGWRFRIMCNESAQLDQYAAWAPLTAFRKPTPSQPARKACKVESALVSSDVQQTVEHPADGGVVGCCEFFWPLWLDGAEVIIRPCDATERENEPRALKVCHGLDTIQQNPVFLGLRTQLGLHKIQMPERCAQNGDSSLIWWQSWVPRQTTTGGFNCRPARMMCWQSGGRTPALLKIWVLPRLILMPACAHNSRSRCV